MKTIAKSIVNVSLILLLFVSFSACKSSGTENEETKTAVTGNPREDAQNLFNEMIQACQKSDLNALEDAIKPYYDHYSKADLEERVAFFKAMRNIEPTEKEEEALNKIYEEGDPSELPMMMKMDRLQQETYDEAQEKGIL